MRLWRTVSLILLAIVVVAAGCGLALTRRGFSARETPSMVEKFAATTALKLAERKGSGPSLTRAAVSRVVLGAFCFHRAHT
jgi:hypothetical protein